MTGNQQRAIALAQALSLGYVSAGSISDADWSLLLLAAGLNNPQSLPQIVSRRVLDRAARGIGYFQSAGTDGAAIAEDLDESEWACHVTRTSRGGAGSGNRRMGDDDTAESDDSPGPWSSPN